VDGLATVSSALGSQIFQGRTPETIARQHNLDLADDRRKDRKAVYVDLAAFLLRCNLTIDAACPLLAASDARNRPRWPEDQGLSSANDASRLDIGFRRVVRCTVAHVEHSTLTASTSSDAPDAHRCPTRVLPSLRGSSPRGMLFRSTRVRLKKTGTKAPGR